MYAAYINGQTIESTDAGLKRDRAGKPWKTPDDHAFLPTKDGLVVWDDIGLANEGWHRIQPMVVTPGHVIKGGTRRIEWEGEHTLPFEMYDTWPAEDAEAQRQSDKPAVLKGAENALRAASDAAGGTGSSRGEMMAAARSAAAGGVPALNRAILINTEMNNVIAEGGSLDDLPPAPHDMP